MNIVRILQVGYMRQEGEVYDADCTVTHVYNEKENLSVLFDTAGPKSKKWLKSIIIQLNLTVDIVVCSHTHYDHIGNLNLFADKKMIVYNELIYKNKLVKSNLLDAKNDRYYLTEDKTIYVLYTPGHSQHDVCLVCENARFHDQTKSQRIIISGDVFDDENDENVWHLYSSDVEKHAKSREIVRQLADTIVPGHGNYFTPK